MLLLPLQRRAVFGWLWARAMVIDIQLVRAFIGGVHDRLRAQKRSQRVGAALVERLLGAVIR